MPDTERKGAGMRRTLGLGATASALAVALLLALTACGGDGDSDGVASLTDTTGQTTTEAAQGSDTPSAKDREQAGLEFARCMREHGVDFPDPVNGRFEFRSQRGDQRKVAEAQAACQHILRDAAPRLSEEQEAEMREAVLDFAKCMRKHGVDMPDPKFQEGGGMTMTMPRGAERDPNFEEAQKACEPILRDARLGEPSGEDGSS
jgi:hypothetical protein